MVLSIPKHIKILVLLLALFLGSVESYATHILGGEITYQCDGTGQFVFRVRVYYDCMSTTPLQFQNLQVLSSNKPKQNGVDVVLIGLNLISETDISPTCDASGPVISCTANNVLNGAIKEFIFESQPTLLEGVIPADGWHFIYTQNFRSTNITNIQSSNNYQMVLHTSMYNYNNSNTSPCYDSSPQILAPPIKIICAGSQVDYNPIATDPDGDVVVHEFSPPLFTNNTLTSFDPPTDPSYCAYTTGYTYNNPTPDQSFDPQNIPATIDPQTGFINFKSNTQGVFILATIAKSYRCGVLISEVYREFNVFVSACTGNNQVPTITNDPTNGVSNNYSITANAGDLITFPITAVDNGTLSNGNPQSVSIAAYGSQFGAGFTNSAAGCSLPPCATLTPAPPSTTVGGTGTTFTWQTDCNHLTPQLGCAASDNTYNFSLVFQDNFCPIPAYTTYNISVTILAPGTTEQSPELRCIAVNSDGSTSLTWEPGIDVTGSWNSYAVYHSNSILGPFTQLTTITNFNTLSYTHTTANASIDSNFYFVTSIFGCLDAPPKDTLAAMLLSVSNGPNGTVSVVWNPPSDPLLPTTGPNYTVYKEQPLGTWNVIGTTSNTFYSEEITVCNDVVNYRIQIADGLGCENISSVDGQIFIDQLPPATPILDSVSVDLISGNATMGWDTSTSSDAVGYLTYYFFGGIWRVVDTLPGYDDTFWLNDSTSNADTVSECFRVAAFDSCGNFSPLGISQCSMLLNGSIDICERKISIAWNPYTGWPEGVSFYIINRKDNFDPYEPYDTVITTADIPLYVDSNIVKNHVYCYYVTAVKNDPAKRVTSSSNYRCFDATLPKAPDFGYITTATVESNSEVYINSRIDYTAIIDHYEVQRKTQVTEFVKLDEIDYTGVDLVEYSDESASTDLSSYTYRIITYDTCLTPTDTTNIATTIHISATGYPNRTNVITWNPYEVWDGEVDRYAVFRQIGGLNSFSYDIIAIIQSNGDSMYTYVDSVDTFTIGDGTFCYFIIGYEGPGNFLGLLATSKSNIDCAEQSANFFVPNAFATDAWVSQNRVFKPVTLFVSRDEYEFTIWDRWGQKIFRTKDLNEGWNGMSYGQVAKQGVYVYSFKYKTALGEYLEKKGTVTLIR